MIVETITTLSKDNKLIGYLGLASVVSYAFNFWLMAPQILNKSNTKLFSKNWFISFSIALPDLTRGLTEEQFVLFLHSVPEHRYLLYLVVEIFVFSPATFVLLSIVYKRLSALMENDKTAFNGKLFF